MMLIVPKTQTRRAAFIYMSVMTRYLGAKMALERMISCLTSLHIWPMLVIVVCA